MAWSYSGDPASSTRDTIRFMIGDTDTSDQLLNNAEIDYYITLHGTNSRIASESARAVAAKFARNMSRAVGGLQADFAAKYRQYMELADNLLKKEESEPTSPFLSGWNRVDKDDRFDNPDREPINGRKGVMDNPRAYPEDTSTGSRGYRLV
jgi:hypothetical protein